MTTREWKVGERCWVADFFGTIQAGNVLDTRAGSLRVGGTKNYIGWIRTSEVFRTKSAALVSEARFNVRRQREDVRIAEGTTKRAAAHEARCRRDLDKAEKRLAALKGRRK